VDPKALVDIYYGEEKNEYLLTLQGLKHQTNQLSYPCSEVGFICSN
jgi:hypothetical protein